MESACVYTTFNIYRCWLHRQHCLVYSCAKYKVGGVVMVLVVGGLVCKQRLEYT